MQRILLSIFACIFSISAGFSQDQAPVLTAWQSATASGTTVQFRMHDRAINSGYALCEIQFDMSAAQSLLTSSVTIFIYENDGSGSYGTLRYSFSYDPGDGSAAFSVNEMTRIQVYSAGATEPLYARAVITGVLPANDFVLVTGDVTTTIVSADSYDPNEGTGTASAIASGTTHSGLLVNNDMDYYPVTISSDYRHLVVHMDYLNDYRTSVAHLDLDLYLDTGTGTLTSSTSSATSTTGPITESIDVVLDPGTYYMIARPKSTDPNRNFYTLNWDTLATPTYQIAGTVETGTGTGISGVVMSGLPGDPHTNVNGEYSATVEHGWSGTVTPTLTGYTFDPLTRTYSDVQEAHSSDNYTATLNTYTISGTVGIDGGGDLSGVLLSGLPGDPVTDVNGDYSVTVDHGWNGTVTPILAGYTFIPVSSTYGSVTSDQVQDYTATLNTYTISGTVTIDGGGALSGVTLSGLPDDPVTDVNGDYSATVDHGWSGTATPTLEGYTFDPVSATYSSVTADQVQDYTATLNSYTISGTIAIDGGAALEGVILSGLPGDPVTDVNGDYSATVDHGWNGVVTPTLTAYTFDPVSSTYGSVTSDQVQDYTATLITYTISGSVTWTGGPLAGVSMIGLPGDPVTDALGNYSVSVDYGWSGTVTPTLPGYTFIPTSTSYSNVTADMSQDYSSTMNTHSISGNISLSGGGALSGVVMSGLPGDPTTDASGNYAASVDHGWGGTVTPILAGYTFDPVSTTYSDVISPLIQDYTATGNTYTISGTVTLAGGGALSGVVMSGLPGDPTTDAGGSYSAGVDHGWSGTVTPTLEGYSFLPAFTDYVSVSGNETTDYTSTLDSYLDIADTVVYLSQVAGSNILIDVISNVGWTVSCDAYWITCSPELGQDDGSFTITADLENGEVDSRTGVVSVTGDGILVTIDVTQAGSGPFLETSVSTVSLASTAGASDVVGIIANLEWTVSEGSDWLSVTPMGGMGDGGITISTDAANESVDVRSATVSVSGGGMTRDIVVNQDGAIPYLDVSSNQVTVGAATGSSQTVTITSNDHWTVNEEVSWLSVTPMSGSMDGAITITATSANALVQTRTATVTVHGSSIAHVIDVTQTGAAAWLEVTAPSDTLAADAGSYISFSISSNADWSITEYISWVSASPSSGTGNRVITVLAESKNTSESDRTATLSITAEGITRTVDVTQKGTEPDPTGLSYSLESAELKLYPNPAVDRVFFESSAELQGRIYVEVMDITGNILHQEQWPGLLAGEPVELDISEYSKGLYMVIISNEETKKVFKLVKNR